jgi:hypothetical protein
VRARDSRGAWSDWSTSTFTAAMPDAVVPPADPDPTIVPPIDPTPMVTPAPTVTPDPTVAPAPTPDPVVMPAPGAAPKQGDTAVEPQGGCSVAATRGAGSFGLGGLAWLALGIVMARRSRKRA